mgnify:CR=1 FL=1
MKKGKNIVKKGHLLFAAMLALMVSTSCRGNGVKSQEGNTTEQQETITTKGKKLVVFFSHAGENYSVGTIKEGNTKIVADYISELTGAGQFEIITHKYDGMSYNQLIRLAKDEAREGELPPYEGDVDVSPFDTIFIGGPIWWGTYPHVMFTFFRDHDLNGKTIIPFTTHEGSGLASCVDDISEAYPEATVTKPFSIYGHEVRTGKAKVEKWLKGL